MFIVNIIFKSLQGRDTLIMEQNEVLEMSSDGLHSFIDVSVSSNSPLNVLFKAATSDTLIQTIKNRVATRDGVRTFVEING